MHYNLHFGTMIPAMFIAVGMISVFIGVLVMLIEFKKVHVLQVLERDPP